jgi:adenylate cyclase
MESELSSDWTRGDVEAQLAKILAGPEFVRNKSLSKFLRFVVEETLDGRGARLKAYTIAIEVFSRDETFDAQSSSIVRVQAARLRQLLEAYYASEGMNDPVGIKMPVGSYKVSFAKNERHAAHVQDLRDGAEAANFPQTASSAPTSDDVCPPALETPRSIWSNSALPVLALALLLSVGLLLWNWTASAPQSTRGDLAHARATLEVKLQLHALADSYPIDTLDDIVERATSAFDSALVTRSGASGSAPSPNAYLLSIDAAPSSRGDEVNLYFKLFRAATGALVWAKDFENMPLRDGDLRRVGNAVSQAVGDTFGAINEDMAARTKPWPEKPRGNVCVLASQEAIRDRTPEKLRRAVECLEADITADPQDANEQDLLAAVLVRRYLDATPGHRGEADLHRALQLARRAYDLEPQRARSAYMLFLTRFYDKRFDEAFVAARKALELNPNASLFSAQIGASYISRGDYARGDGMLEPLKKLEGAPPSFLGAFLSLSAFMRGEEQKFLAMARAAYMENSALGLVLQMIAFDRLHDAQARARAERMLQEKFPGFAADIAAALDRYALAPEIIAKLDSELRTRRSSN